jgi:hypothetical protein
MTTYVLGAGASYHAGYPLASNLGIRLYDWVKSSIPEGNFWRASIEELNELYGGLKDLEAILTALEEHPLGTRAASLSGNTRASIKVCIPEFFNALRNTQAALYDRLADERVTSGDIVITFNYDVLLERSLRKAGLWEISDGYGFEIPLRAIAPSKVKVLKLHGSTNWFGPLFGGMRGFFQAGPNALPSRPAILFPQDFEFLSYPRELYDPLSVRNTRPGILPALITLTRHKRFYVESSSGTREWEDFWRDLWTQAARALRSTDEIVVIGYSMPKADEAARDLLLESANKNAKVTICCGEGSETIRNEFHSCGFRRLESLEGGYFEDFIGR